MAEQQFRRLVYLASPYTHPEKAVEAQRYQAAFAAWCWLLANRQDLHYFIPIVYSHQLCVGNSTMPGDWTFWAEFDSIMLHKCDEFWILCVPGYKESVGVNAERKLAVELGLPIRFLVPDAAGGYLLLEAEP